MISRAGCMISKAQELLLLLPLQLPLGAAGVRLQLPTAEYVGACSPPMQPAPPHRVSCLAVNLRLKICSISLSPMVPGAVQVVDAAEVGLLELLGACCSGRASAWDAVQRVCTRRCAHACKRRRPGSVRVLQPRHQHPPSAERARRLRGGLRRSAARVARCCSSAQRRPLLAPAPLRWRCCRP